jgi:hypothetical protein
MRFRKPDHITLNLMFLLTFPLCLFLGFTGRVDWWVILLIFLFSWDINYKIK